MSRFRWLIATAWRWRPRLMRALGEDGEQIVWVVALEGGDDAALQRALRRAARDYGIVRPRIDPIRWAQRFQHAQRRSRSTGYRRSSERHRAARMKVSAARRREIARMGGLARAAAARRKKCN